MNNQLSSRRIPWVALALSFLSVGVGHIYNGRIAKGLPLYFVWLLIPICISIAMFLPPSTASLTFLMILPVVVVAAVYLYAAIDAWRTAAQIDSDYTLRDYNRASIYWLLIVAQFIFSIGLTTSVSCFMFEAFLVPTRSMNPTILDGDRVLARKMFPKDRFPQRGELVAYQNPTSSGGSTFLGRVVAVAGDEVKIDGERVSINGKELDSDRVPDESLKIFGDRVKGRVDYEVNSGRRYLVNFDDSKKKNPDKDVFEITVPERQVFILGDNRNRSRDSRHFGTIHSGDIVGYVEYIFWPSESWSRFGVANDKLP